MQHADAGSVDMQGPRCEEDAGAQRAGHGDAACRSRLVMNNVKKKRRTYKVVNERAKNEHIDDVSRHDARGAMQRWQVRLKMSVSKGKKNIKKKITYADENGRGDAPSPRYIRERATCAQGSVRSL